MLAKSIIERKGYIPIPLWARIILLKGILLYLGGQGTVTMAEDIDGKSVKTLELLRPNIYTKGGSRTLNNMPQEEIDMCKKINCKIVYGVGGQLNSSRKLAKELK